MPDAAGVAACEAVLLPGQHFITFEVEDADGWTNAATVYFEVREGALIDNDNCQGSGVRTPGLRRG